MVEKHKAKLLALLSLLVFFTATFPVLAECLLPIPDYGGEAYVPSRENFFGVIERIESPFVFIKNGKTHKVEKVSVSKISEIYSVYGGGTSLSKLIPNMQVWVWFENCLRPKNGVPNVAYFQFFSTDPKDRAKLDSNGKILSVPPN